MTQEGSSIPGPIAHRNFPNTLDLLGKSDLQEAEAETPDSYEHLVVVALMN